MKTIFASRFLGLLRSKAIIIMLFLAWFSFSQYQLAFADGNVTVYPTVRGTPVPGAVDDIPREIVCLNATDDVSSPPNSPTWEWDVIDVQFSTDGTSWGPPPGGGVVWIDQDSGSSPFARLMGEFADAPQDGGYWQITCQITDWYDENTYGTATIQIEEPVLAIKIQRRIDGAADYADISVDNLNTNALVGQLIDLKANVIPPNLPGITYLWSLSDTTFKDYVMSTGLTVPKYLTYPDTINQTIQFYWVDAGNKAITCKIQFTSKDGTKTYERNGFDTLTIKSPTVNQFTALIGQPALNGESITYVDKNGKLQTSVLQSIGLLQRVQSPLKLLDQTGNIQQAGIFFDANVGSVKEFGAEGKWAFQQRVYVSFWRTVSTGFGGSKGQHASTNGAYTYEWCCDQTVPYGNTSYATNSGIQETNDTPMEPSLHSPLAMKIDNMKFEMFLMFQPPGPSSKWVPLQVIPWSFSISAQNVGLGNWALVGPTIWTPNPVASATIVFPVWSTTASPHSWVDD